MSLTQLDDSTRRILVVDDETHILYLIKRIFKRLRPGYQIVTSDDGIMAWQQYQQNAYALILTDYTMPGMSGLELVTRMQTLRNHAQIVVMTGKYPDAIPDKLYELTVAGFLPKPFSLTDIQTLLLKLGL